MFLRYGSYTHSSNEVGFTITRQAKHTQGGTYYAYHERWSCRGDLLNFSTQAQITAAIQAITAAYSQDGQDLVLLLDDGETPSAHQLISAQCNGGTRVVAPPSFPSSYGSGEYQPGYGRSYTFEIEAEVPLTTDNVVLTFTESIHSKGNGGPIVVYQETAQGPWIPQQTSQTSLIRATQSGSAVGLYNYPPVPAPIWPAALVNQEVGAGLESPRKYNKYEWPVSWSYTFQGTSALFGVPTVATS